MGPLLRFWWIIIYLEDECECVCMCVCVCQKKQRMRMKIIYLLLFLTTTIWLWNSLPLLVVWTLFEWNHAVFILLCLSSYTQYYVCEILFHASHCIIFIVWTHLNYLPILLMSVTWVVPTFGLFFTIHRWYCWFTEFV